MLNKLVGFTYNKGGKVSNYIYRRNIQGDIIGIYDSLGNEVGGYAYDAYGKCYVKYKDNSSEEEKTILNTNPFRYRGYYYDKETGLYYLNARYYDPSIGRFISPDVLSILDETKGQINGLNLYMYCNNNPIMYVDPSGCFPILACILAITALIGMGLTIGGVATGNNLMTAIGLTMVAIPALISGVGAIIAGIGGATLTGIVGGVTVIAGVGSGLFASAEYQENAGAGNWIQDSTGMSDGLYNTILISIAAIATLGTFASSVGSAFNIKSINGFGKYGDYYGMRFKTGAGKTRVLSFHTHGHKIANGIKSIREWHWQLQKWDPIGNKTQGAIARWIWWNLTRM